MHESAHTYLANEVPLIVDSIVQHVTPCVLADSQRCPDDDIPIGASKFGGRPDVPPDFAWPMTDDGPCWFLGQLNLAHCAEFDVGIEIPTEGLLSFFYHDAGGPAGSKSRMLYFRPNEFKRAELLPDTRWGDDFHSRHLFTRSLNLAQGFCLPKLEELGLSTEQLNAYHDLDDLIGCFNERFADGVHQFFGLPICVWQRVPRHHQLIASFGECNDRIIYFVPDSDAGAMRDSDLRVLYECT